MNSLDRTAYIARYRSRLSLYGHSPQTLGWGKDSRQEVRFRVLAEPALADPGSSVLDVGCGFADLYHYLTSAGWHGEYFGVDIVPELVEIARKVHPGAQVQVMDVTDEAADQLGLYDFVIASGALNAKLEHTHNSKHIAEMINAMRRHARVAAAVDFLSNRGDIRRPDLWYTDPVWAFDLAQTMSRRVAIRHDYLPFEFALFIFCDDRISDRRIFSAFESTVPR